MKNKFIFLVIIALTLLFLVAGALEAAQNASRVPIASIRDKKYVFEAVVDGTPIFHDFILKNEGTASLKIEKVKTD